VAFGRPRSKAESLRQRVAMSRYLAGERTPEAAKVAAINRSAQRVVGLPGIEAVLDALALLSDLMPLDDAKLIAAALQVLESDEASSALVNDWPSRFVRKVEGKSNRDLRRLSAALVVARWGVLLDELVGKTPVRSSSWRISRALRQHGFGDIVAKSMPFDDAIAAFLTAARTELKNPPTTSAKRLAAEQRLLRAAHVFSVRLAGPTKSTLAAALGGFTPTTKGPKA